MGVEIWRVAVIGVVLLTLVRRCVQNYPLSLPCEDKGALILLPTLGFDDCFCGLVYGCGSETNDPVLS